jgi:hypothetical protein
MGWVTYPPLTPPVDVTNPPPLHDMDWQRFERVTVAIYAQEDGIATSDDYGLLGQSDHGVDVIARRAAGGEEVSKLKPRYLIRFVPKLSLAPHSSALRKHRSDKLLDRSLPRCVRPLRDARPSGPRKQAIPCSY